MKKISLVIFAVFTMAITHSQNSIPTLGETAPSFRGETTNGELDFPKDFGDSWKILLSHPQDFTPVCTSEVLELARMQEEFKALNVELVIISVDDISSHEAWKEYMEELLVEESYTAGINFPLVSDPMGSVSNKYGMLHAWENKTRDVRGVFIINRENVIRSISFYPLEVGRNMEEIKRVLVALQTTEEEQVLTPVNWTKGDDVLMKYLPYSRKQLEKEPALAERYYKVGVNLWYKKDDY